MKKYILIIAILVLSLTGFFIALLLLYQHFLPELYIQNRLCGSGMVNTCIAVQDSPYGTIFGIPLAAYGVFFYAGIISAAVIALAGGERLSKHFVAFFLPLSAISVAADCLLAVILITLGSFCALCVATYGLNISMLVAAFLWYRELKGKEGRIRDFYRHSFSDLRSPDVRGVAVSYAIILLLTALAAYLHVGSLQSHPARFTMPFEKVESFVRFYQSLPAESVPHTAHETVIGTKGAPVEIVAFADFSCTACYQLYKAERHLLSRFPRDLSVRYVHFPLDKTCNPHAPRTVYSNSCFSSRAFIAAQEKGMFVDYLVYHFSRYRKNHDAIAKGDVLVSLYGFMEEWGFSARDKGRFMVLMKSGETTAKLDADVELGKAMNVRSVPTLFINGRRIEGVLPVELISAAIQFELGRIKMKK